jgi:ferritin-like metal-binding protein YciE
VHALAEHLEETKEHAARLEGVFRAVGAEPSSNFSPPVEKLAEHHDELASSFTDDRLADVFHAGAAVATEHLELAAYDTLLRLGGMLELGEARELLELNRDEEARALERVESELDRLVGALAAQRDASATARSSAGSTGPAR